MTDITLLRYETGDTGTFGRLYIPEAAMAACEVLELPWRDNRPGVSCIPDGDYEVSYMARSAIGRFEDVYWLREVPARTGILIHAGNRAGDVARGYRADSDGCLLPGMVRGSLGHQPAVLRSREALSWLHHYTGRRGFALHVRGLAGLLG